MLNLPGELLKSGVNNVVSGGRRLVGANNNNNNNNQIKNKTTLTIKGTPNKDAISIAALSTKSGYLLKMNEQGQFHRRFVCIVPHMFLYYFDNEINDNPRGIIDLELFTKVEIEPDNETIKLSSQEEVGLRPYYLQLRESTELGEWVSSLLRDRYALIREERDAYRQLQDHFTGEMESSTRLAKSSSQDLERLLLDLAQARGDTEMLMRHITSALSVIGLSEDQVRDIVTVQQHGLALSTFLRDYMQANERERTEDTNKFNIEIDNYEERINKLEKQIEDEQQARKNIELRCLHDKKDAETRIREAVNQMDQTSLNMQMAVAAKVAAETKCNQLNDQKKILVKEVKQSRKKIEELTDSITALKATIVAQQTQLNILQVSGNASNRDSFRISNTTPLPDIISNSMNNSTILDSDDEDDNIYHHLNTSKDSNHSNNSNINNSNLNNKNIIVSNSIRTINSSDDGEMDESMENISRINSSTTPKNTSYLSNMFGTATNIKNNSQPLLNDDVILSTNNENIESNNNNNNNNNNTLNNTLNNSNNVTNNNNSDAFKLRCLRCNGTVEGPKYSTCKCAIPALCQEDLNNDNNNNDPPSTGLFSVVTNFTRRSSIITTTTENNTNNTNNINIQQPVPQNRRSSITGLFGFGSSD